MKLRDRLYLFRTAQRFVFGTLFAPAADQARRDFPLELPRTTTGSLHDLHD
jgi:hypothetical protein